MGTVRPEAGQSVGSHYSIVVPIVNMGNSWGHAHGPIDRPHFADPSPHPPSPRGRSPRPTLQGDRTGLAAAFIPPAGRLLVTDHVLMDFLIETLLPKGDHCILGSRDRAGGHQPQGRPRNHQGRGEAVDLALRKGKHTKFSEVGRRGRSVSLAAEFFLEIRDASGRLHQSFNRFFRCPFLMPWGGTIQGLAQGVGRSRDRPNWRQNIAPTRPQPAPKPQRTPLSHLENWPPPKAHPDRDRRP
jgi:hypothetical protein